MIETLLRHSFADHTGLLGLLQDELSTFLNEQEAKATLQVVLMVQAEERIMTLGPQYEEQIGRVEAAQMAVVETLRCGNNWNTSVNSTLASVAKIFHDPLRWSWVATRRRSAHSSRCK